MPEIDSSQLSLLHCEALHSYFIEYFYFLSRCCLRRFLLSVSRTLLFVQEFLGCWSLPQEQFKCAELIFL